ncbi:MAG TPA: ABC transporter substrate-binding protein [Candidatus Binatia bacterium]|nr:ABC transporter substrate-binding protein [Candidatus Binatia bacterium]
MKRKVTVLTLCATLFAFCFPAAAQQSTKVPRVGYLAFSTPPTNPLRANAFRQGLRQLGYTEGKDIVIEYRYAEGKLDRLSDLATELVRLKVTIIVTGGPAPTRAAKGATATIPIVMTQDADPVGNGFVASLARPGGNITGLSTHAPEISAKQLELLREILPRLSRVAVFGTSTIPGHALSLREIGLATGPLNIQLQYLDVLGAKDIEAAFRAVTKERADALIVFGGAVLGSQRPRVLEFAVKNRLPVIAGPAMAQAGGLMSYGVNINDLDRRAAFFVDKILKGAKPGDLPVEQPTKFELVINLKTAKQIGVIIPPNVLARADKVIK